jgi:hypothetical protein
VSCGSIELLSVVSSNWAPKLSSLSITRANPATIGICDFRCYLLRDIASSSPAPGSPLRNFRCRDSGRIASKPQPSSHRLRQIRESMSAASDADLSKNLNELRRSHPCLVHSFSEGMS